MHAPQLVFLDEPTTGLDPQSRANLWEHIRSLRDDAGVTILLTTHYLEEADALADRILVMDGGRLVADDTPGGAEGADLRRRRDACAARVPTSRAEHVVRARSPCATSSSTDGALHVTVDEGAVAVAPLLRGARRRRAALASVAVSRPTLDDVFLTLTGRTLRESRGRPEPAQVEPSPMLTETSSSSSARCASCCATRCGSSSG